MIYSVANIYDMSILPPVDKNMWVSAYENACILTNEYGADRDIFEDDGGIVLVVPFGTPAEELRQKFDYTKHIPEYVCRSETQPYVITAGYLLNNDYMVVIVIHEYDCPKEILTVLKEGY